MYVQSYNIVVVVRTYVKVTGGWGIIHTTYRRVFGSDVVSKVYTEKKCTRISVSESYKKFLNLGWHKRTKGSPKGQLEKILFVVSRKDNLDYYLPSSLRLWDWESIFFRIRLYTNRCWQDFVNAPTRLGPTWVLWLAKLMRRCIHLMASSLPLYFVKIAYLLWKSFSNFLCVVGLLCALLM